jgi:hypothetical protein
MPSIRYKGPYDAVEVPSLNLPEVTKGDPIDVTDSQAEGLLSQESNWELVPATAKAPAVPAAPTTTDNQDGK